MSHQRHKATAQFYQMEASADLIKLKSEWYTHFHNGITLHLDDIKNAITKMEKVIEGLSSFDWQCGATKVRTAKKVSTAQQEELAKELAQFIQVQMHNGADTSNFVAAWQYVMQPTAETLSIMEQIDGTEFTLDHQ